MLTSRVILSRTPRAFVASRMVGRLRMINQQSSPREPQYIPTEDLEAERIEREARRNPQQKKRREPQFIPTEDLEAERAERKARRMLYKNATSPPGESQYIPTEDLEAQQDENESHGVKWEPDPNLVPEDWREMRRKKRAEYLKQYVQQNKDLDLGDEHHFVPVDDQHLPPGMRSQARLMKKKKSEEKLKQYLKDNEDWVLGDEHHFVPMDEKHLPSKQTNDNKSKTAIPHVNYPLNYPTVEQINSIVKEKEEKAKNQQEDNIRHHAWE